MLCTGKVHTQMSKKNKNGILMMHCLYEYTTCLYLVSKPIIYTRFLQRTLHILVQKQRAQKHCTCTDTAFALKHLSISIPVKNSILSLRRRLTKSVCVYIIKADGIRVVMKRHQLLRLLIPEAQDL